jgi:chromosome segregation ATPase/ubiquinone/menaquinone biosynthesis C-methylase UbiE
MPQHPWIERLVHYQYITELVEGKRVLEVGCGQGKGAAFLAEVARQVVAVDASSVELSQCRRTYPRPNLEFLVGEPDRLQLESHSFDVVLVPDLMRWITRGSFMPEMRRLLGPGGIALFAVPNGDQDGNRGMAFHDFVEYLVQGFPQVQMMGAMPFFGTIVAEFEPKKELEPQIDASLVEEDEPPAVYLALCSDQPLPTLGYSVLQIPAAETHLRELEGLREKFDHLVEERAEAELKLESLQSQVADAERRALETGIEARHELTGLRRELRDKAEKLAEVTRETEAMRGALEEARSLQREGDRAVDDVVQELRQQMEAQHERAQVELQQARQRLEQHVETSQRRIRQLEQELDRARGGGDGAAEAGLVRELREARARIVQLEGEIQELHGPVPDMSFDAGEPGGGEEVTLRHRLGAEAPDRVAQVEKNLERQMRRAEALEERLQAERDRLDRERDRAEEAARKYLEERGRADVLHVRAEAAERALQEARVAADQQRQRAEGAERRCDALVIRIEQSAGELSGLHHRVAEVQGLRQADQWRIDELTGRLREQEQRFTTAAAGAAEAAAPAELVQAKRRIRDLESERTRIDLRVRELEAARAASAEAEARVADLEKQTAELEVQRKQYADVVADLERKLMVAESRAVEHSRKATNAESKNVQMEVRLKRAESEAATLSKWAEELREELKEAQGKSTARPATPEPEVAALRNDLREAHARIAELEARCDRFMHEAQQATAALREKEQALAEALRSADGNLLDELQRLRGDAAQAEAARETLPRLRRELAEAERSLRDMEQAETELHRTRRELEELRQRVKDVDASTEELEQLRLESVSFREAAKEAERLRAELEDVRIELARAQDELRGGGTLGEEAPWHPWSSEAEPSEDEHEEEEYEGYLGPEMGGRPEFAADEGEDGEASWDVEERLQVRERQLEALLGGAAIHRQEMDRLQAQVSEMDALVQELQSERVALEAQFATCDRALLLERSGTQQLRDELTRVGRELARARGELQRCADERDLLASRGSSPEEAAVVSGASRQDDLDREVRGRQRLQDELHTRLREIDELHREVREKERVLDLVRTEDVEHRAEVRELRRQLRELEDRLSAVGEDGRMAEELDKQLAGASAQMAELEARLRAEAEHLAVIEARLRGIALDSQSSGRDPGT